MGVVAKWGRFPICPEMSRFVPVCPLLSQFFPVPGPKKDKRGQTGTKRDISGQIGTPPFSNYPHLALLNLSAPNHKSQIASDLKSRIPNRKNFPQIAVLDSSNRTFKSRDL